MIDLIKNLKLKKNDVLLFKIDKNERARNIHRIISDLSRELKFRIFGIFIRDKIDIEVLTRDSKIKLKKMLEESLKEEPWK